MLTVLNVTDRRTEKNNIVTYRIRYVTMLFFFLSTKRHKLTNSIIRLFHHENV